MRTDLEAVFDPMYLIQTIDLQMQSSFGNNSRENGTRLDIDKEQWHCPEGILGSFQQVMDEYVEYRNI
jgi:hypothetical protein